MNAKINDFIPLLRFISLINSKTIEQFINRIKTQELTE